MWKNRSVQFELYLITVEGKSRVLGHWACYKVETSTADEDETARQVKYKIGLGRIHFWPDTGYPANYVCRISGIRTDIQR